MNGEDYQLQDHQKWLGYLQPEGFVVWPHARHHRDEPLIDRPRHLGVHVYDRGAKLNK